MLLMTVTVTEKNPVEGTEDPARKGWIWDQEQQRRKRSDGKRRILFHKGKFKFYPPFVFDRLEEIPDRYEMPDWVEEEDNRNKKSREKKQPRSNKPKKGKKKNPQIQRSIEPTSTGRQRRAQNRLLRSEDNNVPSGEVNLSLFTNL